MKLVHLFREGSRVRSENWYFSQEYIRTQASWDSNENLELDPTPLKRSRMSVDFSSGSDSNTITASKEDRLLIYNLWPESFLGLYEMGFRSFERLFNHRPQLKAVLELPEDDRWKNDERLKKIVLSLQQTLVLAVATFAEEEPDPENTPENFSTQLQEIGGFHRLIIPSLNPDNFELLFKLLPEVIADVTSSRRESGPLKPDERVRLVGVWTSITSLMARQFVYGWERRIVPKNSKFSEIYRSAKSAQDKRPGSQQPTRTRAASDATGSSAQRRTPSRHGPPRSRTQVEMSASAASSTHSSQASLERGYSAPIALHDLELEFHPSPST